MFDIVRYSAGRMREWNAFVFAARNATFLIDRNYMDYHSGRFADHSLMFYKGGALYAVMPANESGGVLYSHQGLTYGGLVMGGSVAAADTVTLFSELNAYLAGCGIHKVVYKAIPWIYHRVPSEEDVYAIFRVCGAQLSACDISSAISSAHRLKWSRDRRYGINKALRSGVEVGRSDDFAAFWPVLEGNLGSKYGVRPVHTLAEMQLLHSRFPNNIRLYVARRDGRVLGGTVLYLTPQVVHAQYISACTEGKQLRVIDAIYDVILNRDFADAPYFDFGKSTEDCGAVLNASLIYQKEGFGGRGVCYNTYTWQV